MCRIIKQNPNVPLFKKKKKSIQNIDRIICVTCTFHLRWVYLPAQSIDDAQWNIAYNSVSAVCGVCLFLINNFIFPFQKTGRLFVINPENDLEKDKDMVQQLLGKMTLIMFV